MPEPGGPHGTPADALRPRTGPARGATAGRGLSGVAGGRETVTSACQLRGDPKSGLPILAERRAPLHSPRVSCHTFLQVAGSAPPTRPVCPAGDRVSGPLPGRCCYEELKVCAAPPGDSPGRGGATAEVFTPAP